MSGKRLKKHSHNLMSVGTKPGILRLAKRAGIKRASGGMQRIVRQQMVIHLARILKAAVTMAEHDRRKTVMATDVVHGLESLQKKGQSEGVLFGYGG